MTSIYLVRHAQSEGNLTKRFQGRIDTPLTELGFRQAEMLALRFGAIPLDAVYTSPMTRTRQTAEVIAAPHGLTPVVEPDLIEINGGKMENMSFSSLMEEYPEQFRQFDREPHLFEGFDGGENMHCVYERTVKAVVAIAERHPNQTVLLVSHGSPIRCFLSFARAHTIQQLGDTDWGKNSGVSHVTFHEGNVMLHRMNDLSHIPDELAMEAWGGAAR